MIDLHVHSTASDGTLTPEELADKGRHLAVMALTDHDNTDGCRRFLDACVRLGVQGLRLPGIELSIDPGEGYGRFHLLGLGIDPAAPCLVDFLGRIRAGRAARNVQILDRLAELGMPVAEEEVRRYANGPVIARPHIARVLVEKRHAKDVKDAFARYLGEGAPAYVERFRPSQEESIAVIHAARGAAVMAHPRFWSADRAMLQEGFARLKELGLDGVESVYQANEPLETPMHRRLAAASGLAETAGSDFHGVNKPTVTLGMAVENQDEAEFLRPLMEALARQGCPFVR